MATQDQGLAHLLEQSALYKHIQVYHWLADSWNWTEMAKLFTQDTEFEFEVVSTADSQAGSFTHTPDLSLGVLATVLARNSWPDCSRGSVTFVEWNG